MEMVKPGASPGGRKRTAPLPRAVLPPVISGTFDVTEVVPNGAFIKTAGSVVLLPARMAIWLLALMPTSSNPAVPAGSGIVPTVELLLNGAAMPAA